ncbi:hypothetical protein BGZ68_001509 [Mortierella alpina]|nr:hypothetical protein BGZ68_001509 [Mortierella alpina]
MILELLQMCPFMDGMVVPKLNEQDAITYLAPVVAKAMPQLRYLNINLISEHPLANCHLVRSCKNLVSLNINRLKFDSRSLVDAVVSEHGHSLQALYIERSDKLTSQQLNFILSNCPRLLSLYALVLESGTRYSSPILNSEDMAMVPVKPGWSCKDLETLHLCYSTEDTNIGIPEVLWRQIGQLSKLKDLTLLRRLREGTGVQEQESVMQAVHSWKALTDLRWLKLRNLDAFLDKKLVDQAKDQWAKLEWVRYSYIQSEERDGVS